MPVKYAVLNDLKLYVHVYSGRVSPSEIADMVDGLARQTTGHGTYRGLAVFSRDVDLSELDAAALDAVRNRSKGRFLALGNTRGQSAAMVGGSHEARIVMPLWNALCDADPDFDHRFSLFTEIEPALAFLGLPPDRAGEVSAFVAS